jgi:micrococcal nuclease
MPASRIKKGSVGKARQIGAVILTVAAVAAGSVAYKHLVNPYEKVYKVADGDTFILDRNKQTVRLFSLDAPELANCYGPESYARLSQLLQGGWVQLKEPVVDRFGRIVALVYVNGQLINEILLREGFVAYQSEPGSEQQRLKAAHLTAVSKRRGIYSSVCTDESPPDPKCAIKGNHDLDRHGYFYLSPDCPYYSPVLVRRFEGDRWFCTESEAKAAGFTASPACLMGKSRSR